MYTLLMESNEIFRTTSPREMTCELFGKNRGVHFKNHERVLQTQRAKQTLKKSKIFSLVVGIIISKETTRRSKSYASTLTTLQLHPKPASVSAMVPWHQQAPSDL